MLRLPRSLLAASLLAPPQFPATPSSAPPKGPATTLTITRETLEQLPLRGGVDDALETIPGARPTNAWMLDGADVTGDAGPEWTSALTWRHFAQVSLHEVRFDSSVPAGRPLLAIVTRSGSNRGGGSATVDYTDHRLQADNVTPALRAQGAGFGNPIVREADLDIDSGGPLVRDRAWWWGALSRSRHETGVVGFWMPAVTVTTTAGGKVDVRWRAAHRTSVTWTYADKASPNRGASAFDRAEATTRQSSLGAAQPFRVQHAWAASDAFSLDAAFTIVDAGMILDFQSPSLSAVQPAYDRFTLVSSRSTTRSRQERHAVRVVSSASVASRRGQTGESSARFGVEWNGSTERQGEMTGGGAVAVFDSRSGRAGSWQARVFRDGATSHHESRLSAYVDESLRFRNVTIEAGIRFDRQDDAALEATAAANGILPDLLPAVHFPGADSGVVFRDISPSAATTWTSPGARTIVRAGIVRSRATGNDTSTPLQPTSQTRLTYWWNDTNLDSFIQRSELDLARGFAATPSSNYDPASPSAVRTPASVDPALGNVLTDELSVGIERQLAFRLALRASYVARRIHRMRGVYPVGADGSAVESSTYFPVRWAAVSCPPAADCPPVTYWRRDAQLPSTTLLRNDGRYGWQQAVTVAAHRRASQGWMLDAAATWNVSVVHFPVPTRDYTDPTNIAQRDGTDYSMADPRWDARVSGSARLPWRTRTSAIFTAKGGLPYDRALSSPNRGALGPTSVSIDRYGSIRYPSLYTLDWRFESRHAIRGVRVTPALDVFNVLNASTPLSRNRIQNSATANRIVRIAPPRLLRVHLAIAW